MQKTFLIKKYISKIKYNLARSSINVLLLIKYYLLQLLRKKNLDFSYFLYNYSSTGASTGHTLAHVPQLMHCSGSISYLSPLSAIHETGQLAAQAPQAIHLSVIL